MKAKLVVVDGGDEARQYDLRLPTIIGRSRRTDLMLGHPLVSRQHCEVFEADGILMVRDLGSLNGTFIGETRLAEDAVPVNPGDLFTVGGVTFRAEYLSKVPPAKSVSWDPQAPTIGKPPRPKTADDAKKRRIRAPRVRPSDQEESTLPRPKRK